MSRTGYWNGVTPQRSSDVDSGALVPWPSSLKDPLIKLGAAPRCCYRLSSGTNAGTR